MKKIENLQEDPTKTSPHSSFKKNDSKEKNRDLEPHIHTPYNIKASQEVKQLPLDIMIYWIQYLPFYDFIKCTYINKMTLKAIHQKPGKDNDININTFYLAVQFLYQKYFQLKVRLEGSRLIQFTQLKVDKSHITWSSQKIFNIINRDYKANLSINNKLFIQPIHLKSSHPEKFDTEKLNHALRRSEQTFIAIAACEYHFLLLDSERKVYGLGSNKYKQLGSIEGSPNWIEYPTIIQHNHSTPITKIYTSKYSSLLIDNNGQLISIGEINRKLNPSQTANLTEAYVIPCPDVKFKHANLSRRHIIAIDCENRLWGIGNNSDLQLGLAYNHHEVNLTEMTMIWNKNPIFLDNNDFPKKVFCNYFQSYILTNQGKVYASGKNLSTHQRKKKKDGENPHYWRLLESQDSITHIETRSKTNNTIATFINEHNQILTPEKSKKSGEIVLKPYYESTLEPEKLRTHFCTLKITEKATP